MKELETVNKILSAIQNQKDEKMYDLTWVGRNYSKKNLIEDLKKVKQELESKMVS